MRVRNGVGGGSRSRSWKGYEASVQPVHDLHNWPTRVWIDGLVPSPSPSMDLIPAQSEEDARPTYFPCAKLAHEHPIEDRDEDRDHREVLRYR